MKKQKRRSGFALSDALIGLLIICLAGLTYGQAHSLMVKRLATQEAAVAVKRQKVEQAWLKWVQQAKASSSKANSQKKTAEKPNQKPAEPAKSESTDKPVEMAPLEEVTTP